MSKKATWEGNVPATTPEGAHTGIQLNIGDEISVIASGWIKYGKEDFALAAPRGRVRAGLETRDDVVLKARFSPSGKGYDIGTGVFRWAVPEAGELILYVADNADGYADNSGSFSASVYL